MVISNRTTIVIEELILVPMGSTVLMPEAFLRGRSPPWVDGTWLSHMSVTKLRHRHCDIYQ